MMPVIRERPEMVIQKRKECYSATNVPAKAETAGKLYRVRVGVFKKEANAEKLVKELKAKGYQAAII